MSGRATFRPSPMRAPSRTRDGKPYFTGVTEIHEPESSVPKPARCARRPSRRQVAGDAPPCSCRSAITERRSTDLTAVNSEWASWQGKRHRKGIAYHFDHPVRCQFFGNKAQVQYATIKYTFAVESCYLITWLKSSRFLRVNPRALSSHERQLEDLLLAYSSCTRYPTFHPVIEDPGRSLPHRKIRLWKVLLSAFVHLLQKLRPQLILVALKLLDAFRRKSCSKQAVYFRQLSRLSDSVHIFLPISQGLLPGLTA